MPTYQGGSWLPGDHVRQMFCPVSKICVKTLGGGQPRPWFKCQIILHERFRTIFKNLTVQGMVGAPTTVWNC